jgi:hypothetical protein
MFARFLAARAPGATGSGIIEKIALGGSGRGWKENQWLRESKRPWLEVIPFHRGWWEILRGWYCAMR